mgnify:CR=1 FL=1
MAATVLFLCSGNICRSPVAEVVARARFGGPGLEFGSAGLDTIDGHGPSSGSVVWASVREFDLATHRSRQVTVDRLEGVDWVIGMTRGHAALFRNRMPSSYHGGVGYLGAPGFDLAGGAPSPEGEEVEDPYGGSQADYDAACGKIQRLIEDWEPVFEALSQGKEGDRP